MINRGVQLSSKLISRTLLLALSTLAISSCEQNYGITLSSLGDGTGTKNGVTPTGSTVLPTSPPSGPGLGGPVTLPPVNVTNGALDGHFDLDTATTGMPWGGGNTLGNGTVSAHVHQYDKVNQTTTVDFFHLSTKNVNGVANTSNSPTLINLNTLAASQRFYLIVVNSTLNPGAIIQINGGAPVSGTAYQAKQQTILGTNGTPQAYTLGPPAQGSHDLQLTDLVFAINPNLQVNSLLLPTAPKNCVFPNIAGHMGEYRNGAFVIQAVDATNFVQDSTTGAATSNGGMLWEAVIYNHFMIPDPDGDGSEKDPEYCYGATVDGQIFY